MARTTITQITDDLDGSKGAEEVAFSYRGVDYVIDLSKKNQSALDKVLKPYLDAATKTTRQSSTKATRKSTAGRPSTKKNRSSGRDDLVAVREWARSNGIEVAERGRIASSVLEQYKAATT